MRNYKILKLSYPGVIRIETGSWIKFNINNEKFAFAVSNFKKGLVIFDPDNEIIFEEKYRLRKETFKIQEKSYAAHPQGVKGDLQFYSVTESAPEGRCFYAQSYTELFLLLEDPKKKITIDFVNYYLNHLFVRFNTNYFKSTILIPKPSYWEESMKILEANFKSTLSFDNLIKTQVDTKLAFSGAAISIQISKHGVLPTEKSHVIPVSSLKEIPENYFDIFELYSSGLMQMNYYKNFKLALLETFVAVEILVVRITDEQKINKGVSKGKIRDYKKVIDVAYRMDVELKIFFSFSKNEKLLLSKVVRARGIRNKIMHDNYKIDESEIREIIENINAFLFMLIDKSTRLK